MTKSQCYSNLGLILLVGAIIAIVYNLLSNEPDYMRSGFAAFLGIFFVSIFPASIILLIGLVIQWFKKPERETAHPQTGSAFIAYSYTSQTEEYKKKVIQKEMPKDEVNITLPSLEKMEAWEKINSLGKSDTKAKTGWKTIFIIAWIVFALSNFFMLYGSLMSLNSD